MMAACEMVVISHAIIKHIIYAVDSYIAPMSKKFFQPQNIVTICFCFDCTSNAFQRRSSLGCCYSSDTPLDTGSENRTIVSLPVTMGSKIGLGSSPDKL